ncbi:MAG: helicase-related protein, partial [Candidatus Micrarchaeota archaeon]
MESTTDPTVSASLAPLPGTVIRAAPSLSLLSPAAPPPRVYQSAICEAVLKNGSTLVVLPTGLGKTLVAILVAAAKLNEGGRVLFLAPTRPLAAQHEKVCREWLTLKPEEIVLVSGLIEAKKRAPLYLPPNRLVISTPQTIANDLESGRLKFDFSLAIFDECHRAVGKYAYTYVANAANGKLASADGSPHSPTALVLGLTASPGGDRKKITDILNALGIRHVQIRTPEDADVKPYVKPLEIEWIKVELTPALLDAKAVLQDLIAAQTETLRKMGFVGQFASKKSLAQMRARILASNSSLRFSALSHHATLFSLVHVQELLETQGVESVQRFVQRVREREPSKAQVRLLHNPHFMAMVEKLKSAAEHPKLAKLVELAKSRPPPEKTIVFCQYRDQVGVLVHALTTAGLRAQSFMGKKDGVTAKDQQKTLADFREGLFDILVATSIGEEGLDIPSVDNVIFYEPVASEIRHIQRRGRAGRAKLGRMFGLMTTNTRDQAFFW